MCNLYDTSVMDKVIAIMIIMHAGSDEWLTLNSQGFSSTWYPGI